jgi:hypothetical protein
MDATAQFVSDFRVARFVDRVRLECDPTMRASLQGLPFKELENLNFNFEQVSNVERYIAERMRRIEIRKSCYWSRKRSSHDVVSAENTLGNPKNI